MGESVEVSIARMEEQLKALLSETVEAKSSRKEHYAKLEDMSLRMRAVEQQLAAATPTLAEFIVLKHKIAGAGFVGRWVWIAAAFLVGSFGTILASVSGLKAWLLGD